MLQSNGCNAEGGAGANRVVFACMAFVTPVESVTVGSGDEREEYAMLKARLDEELPGAALFTAFWFRDFACPPEYVAVVVLRGKLATIGDLVAILAPTSKYRVESVRECLPGCRLEKFLEDMQNVCLVCGVTHGDRILLQRGDVEVERMLNELSWVQRNDGKNVELMQQLNAGMREFQSGNVVTRPLDGGLGLGGSTAGLSLEAVGRAGSG